MRKMLILFVVLFLPALASADPHAIRILHINDLHGFVHSSHNPGMSEPLGGAAQLAEKINMLRAEKPSILLSAGDMIQGDSWANLASGASAIELMNVMRFDAMTTGNHEYDFGQDVLRQRIAQASFPVLAANVNGLEGLKPYILIERGGLRIAVIGLVTMDTPETSHPDNTRGLRFTKPFYRALELVRQLRSQADLIVLLTHIGYSEDRALAEALTEPLSAAPHNSMLMGNLLIVGGHSHTRVEHPTKIGTSCVAQAWEHGKTLGIIDVTVDAGKIVACDGHLEEIRSSATPGDPAVATLVRHYDDQVQATLGLVIGQAGIDLIQEGIRQRETNLGNLVADIVRQSAGADAAIINGGSIRTGIRRGPVTMQGLYSVLPFNNYIVAVRMSGRQLRATLEHGVSGIERSEGRFPQVSGLRFAFDPAKPAGNRVSEIRAGGKPLDDSREYTVATLDFMAAGGDGYREFGEAIRSGNDFSDLGGALQSSRLVYNNPGRWLREVVSEYLGKHPEVSPVIENRIVNRR